MHESPKACFNISKVSLLLLPNLTQNLMHNLCSSTFAIPPISENHRWLMQYTKTRATIKRFHIQPRHRHTHSQDTTATHPSRKLVNYKRLACYEHCPGTFGYTFVSKIHSMPMRLHVNHYCLNMTLYVTTMPFSTNMHS